LHELYTTTTAAAATSTTATTDDDDDDDDKCKLLRFGLRTGQMDNDASQPASQQTIIHYSMEMAMLIITKEQASSFIRK
jgi:hypothetical protein